MFFALFDGRLLAPVGGASLDGVCSLREAVIRQFHGRFYFARSFGLRDPMDFIFAKYLSLLFSRLGSEFRALRWWCTLGQLGLGCDAFQPVSARNSALLDWEPTCSLVGVD